VQRIAIVIYHKKDQNDIGWWANSPQGETMETSDSESDTDRSELDFDI